MLRTIRVALVSLFVLLLSVIANAQGGVATGDLHVTVKDPKGNVVTNATVTVAGCCQRAGANRHQRRTGWIQRRGSCLRALTR